jgi:hypothetical protein
MIFLSLSPTLVGCQCNRLETDAINGVYEGEEIDRLQRLQKQRFFPGTMDKEDLDNVPSPASDDIQNPFGT